MLFRDIERVFDPWREFERLEREFRRMGRELERLFGEDFLPTEERYPAINLYTSEEEAMVDVELPGVEPKDVDITVVGRRLTIQAKRPEPAQNGARYHLRERHTGELVRHIELPFNVNPDKVEAHYHNGILSIKLPRAEEEKPRKIEVKAE
ncbi:MAG: Hsp20/alpha crystallin family protein [Nitrospirae bacterium]|nr:MAG: Hsp20/alpha crystallin family protein [Nitrospirota bacterium]